MPVVLNRGQLNPNDHFDPDPFPQTLPVALVNSAGQALNTLSVTVNDAASATTTGVTISNLSVDSAGQVTASLAATCAASSATFTLRVIDSLGQSKTTPLAVALSPIFGSPRNPLPATLPNGKAGVPYSVEIRPASLLLRCNASDTIQLTGGKLPFGLSLEEGGLSCEGIVCKTFGPGVRGVPTSGGSSTFTITWSFSNGDTFSRDYTINIASEPLEMPAGMLSWWNAEHGVQDIAERNHGQASNGFGPKDFEIGHVGLAFRFNGSSGAARLPNNLSLFPTRGSSHTPFTFETWFKTASGGVIIGQQNSDPWGTTPTLYTPGLYVGMDGKLRAMMFYYAPGATSLITSATAVNDNRFHHVAVVYDGNEQVVYLDGDEMGRASHQLWGNSDSYRYQFGTGYTSSWPSAPNGWYGFKGLIDEPTFFDRALDAQEVRAIFGAGQAGKIMTTLKVINPLCAAPSGSINIKGAVQINVKGGYGPFSYSRTDPYFNITLPYGPDNFFSGLWSGYDHTFYIRDGRGYTIEKSVRMLDPAIISLSPSSIDATVIVGQPFTQSFQASGGTGKKTLTLSGALPSGLTLTNDPANSAGTISGSTAQSGSFVFTITATDQNGCARSQSYTLVINATPTITAAAVTRTAGGGGSAQIGAVEDFNDASNNLVVTVNGSISSVTVTAPTNFTGGVTVNPATRVVSISNAGPVGSFTISVTATDNCGATATKTFQMTVDAPVVVGWGYNLSGQVNIPADLRDVTTIAAGEEHNLALKSDGTVVAWGRNLPTLLNIPAGLSGVKAISAGGYHSLALKSDRTIVAWGNDAFGEGNIPAGLSGVTAIAAGNYYSLVLRTNPIMVTNTNDSGPGSLRQAIADAAPGGAIDFDLRDCPCTITLTSGELSIIKPLTINGPGANLLSINGNNSSRVFNVVQSGAVALSGLTATNGNGSGGVGGGIRGYGGTLIINDCAIVGNSALSGPNNGAGGGIHVNAGVLWMAGSVISGNRAGFIGGVSIENATANLINCTISGNSVIASGSGIVARGSSEVTLTNSTVTANSSPGGDGAVRADSQWGATVTIKLKNTLVANNGSRNFTIIKWPSGNSATIISLGNNLDGDGSSGFTNGVNGDLVGTASNPLDALLGPLADNGGPTRTHALLPGSPAIDAGGNALVRDANGNHLWFDQRGQGFLRLIGGAVDVGAFEAQPSPPPGVPVTGADNPGATTTGSSP